MSFEELLEEGLVYSFRDKLRYTPEPKVINDTLCVPTGDVVCFLDEDFPIYRHEYVDEENNLFYI